MTKADLTTAPNTAYKMKVVGADGKTKWSPLLHFVKEKGVHLFFKPVDDTLSTLETEVIQVYIGSEEGLAKAKTFIMCKHYGEWEKSPHICGVDCPLSQKEKVSA